MWHVFFRKFLAFESNFRGSGPSLFFAYEELRLVQSDFFVNIGSRHSWQKQFIQPGWALSLYFYVFGVEWFIFLFMYVLYYLGQLSHFPSCCGPGVTNLNEPPSSFLLPPRCCGLRAIVNKKQCETRGLFMSLVIHYWIGDVQDSQGVSISQNANYNF